MAVAKGTHEVVGREEELDALTRFIEDVERRPAALILEGDAGVGKTTLWRDSIRIAQAKGHRVLTTSGAPNEAGLAFSALTDLLESALDDVLPQLPAPQRTALETTLLRAESTRAPTARVISAALLTSLRELAKRAPLLVAIDDVQWLDPPSANALGFAFRRLSEERIALLVALRTGDGARPPLGLANVPFAERVGRLTVGPMSFGALRHLLLSRDHLPITRPLLRRIHETSGGNPLFALELARALARHDPPPNPIEPLPVPADLRRLLAESIAQLPIETREALLVMALMVRPSFIAIANATGRSGGELRPAFDAQVIEEVDGAIRFAHPLLRSAVYAEAPAVVRRQWQRRLADVVSDLEERAHYLALASSDQDETVAQQLELAGVRAHHRGAPLAAAGLLEHAIRLTPQGQTTARARRGVAAADAWFECGDRRRAVELCEEVRRMIPHGLVRADALQRLADKDNAETLEHAIAYAEEALLEAAGDPRREVDVLLRLANLEHFRENWPAAVECATRAVRVAEDAGHLDATASALTALGIYQTFLGVGCPSDHYRRAIELEAKASVHRGPAAIFSDTYWAPQTMLSDWQRKDGKLDEARSLLDGQYRRALDAGDEGSRLRLCVHLAELELSAGHLDLAQRWNHEAMALAEEMEAPHRRSLVLCSIAAVEAYRGDLRAALTLAEEAKVIAHAFGDELWTRKARAVKCFAELSAEHYEDAVSELGPSLEHPILAVLPLAGDGIEALIGAGRVDKAREQLDELEAYAARTELRMFRMLAARCRGLLSAAYGELESALDTLEQALTLAAELPLPLERGRTLMMLGQVRRRAKKKRAARESLEAARIVFAQIGAKRWIERADAELARIGGRAPTPLDLTPTERRVAELVAQGYTNREVASALVNSVRAVEANLTRIYAKLGVRSRTELAHLLARMETPPPTS